MPAFISYRFRNNAAVLFFLLLLPFSSYAVSVCPPADSSRYAVLDQLRRFIRDELQLDIGDAFYTSWGEGTRYSYVYVSRTDSLLPPAGISKFMYVGEDSLRADSMAREYAAVGFHTLHYRTAGTSAAKLNPTLWNYPIEAFVFIILHEAVHVHIRRTAQPVPYACEEALCDATADYYTPLFLQGNRQHYRAALRQRHVFEQVYALLNRAESDFYRSVDASVALRRAGIKLRHWVKNGNAFQRDRYTYPLNNAYLMRNHSYAAEFFFFRDQLKCYTTPAAILPHITSAGSEAEAVSLLRELQCIPPK